MNTKFKDVNEVANIIIFFGCTFMLYVLHIAFNTDSNTLTDLQRGFIAIAGLLAGLQAISWAGLIKVVISIERSTRNLSEKIEVDTD